MKQHQVKDQLSYLMKYCIEVAGKNDPCHFAYSCEKKTGYLLLTFEHHYCDSFLFDSYNFQNMVVSTHCDKAIILDQAVSIVRGTDPLNTRLAAVTTE